MQEVWFWESAVYVVSYKGVTPYGEVNVIP
jgi:hypothetical protein